MAFWLLGLVSIIVIVALLLTARSPHPGSVLASTHPTSVAPAHAHTSTARPRTSTPTALPHTSTSTPLPTHTPGPTATPTPPSPFRLYVGPTTDVWLFVHGIQEAQRRVLLQIGALGDSRVVDALVHAAGRGVDVRVLYDPTGVDPGVITLLSNAGVLTRRSSPDFTATSQDSLVVDTRYILVGTGMLTPAVLNGARSFIIRDVDERAAAQLAAVFYDDWLRRPASSFVPDIILGPDQSQNTVVHVADLAAQTIDMYTSRLDDSTTISALLRARQRGVTLRVILAGDAQTGGAAALISGGVEVRRLDNPLVRATVLIEDGRRVYLSSLDLTNTALTATRGVGMMLDDHGVLESLESTFTRDWNMSSIVRLPSPTPVPRPTTNATPIVLPTPRPTP